MIRERWYKFAQVWDIEKIIIGAQIMQEDLNPLRSVRRVMDILEIETGSNPSKPKKSHS